ncbi:hypothetical protein LSH36_373g01006 [Paralvinella palmiformis]|uniref:Cap-specific mRNA (nucleoside-2'-O-)-methyltransferase 2 n=1 Tax=Paralvinella palmiformis TaxID=53620 RepID=A0AAD9JF07_9ANNE|nr:hypothetical protein LSH36_373g01006 [Paralvinella palmiformis]
MSEHQEDSCQSQNSDSDDKHSVFYQTMTLLADQNFNKEFVYPICETLSWTDPSIQNVMFSESRWTDPLLQDLKRDLNERKALLSDLDIVKWHNHTTQTHPGGLIMRMMKKHFNAEMCTQAWCKFREIVHRLDLESHLQEDQLRTVHLCEAPGAFITSFNHYLRNRGFINYWIWLGVTLNPYYEGNSRNSMIDDDRFINNTLDHWYFGSDNTGDIINMDNAIGLIKLCRDMGGVHLVTADGSVDCADNPGEQENVTSALHYSEVTAALHVLKPGGHFVLKMFTMFEDESVGLMYILRSCFDKPVTSKPGNSELYVIAQDFKGLPDSFLEILLSQIESNHSKCILPEHIIVDGFLTSHRRCCQMFTKHQMDAISENLQLFRTDDNLGHVIRLKMLREGCQTEYVNRYEIKALDRMEWIVCGQGKKYQTYRSNYVSLTRRHTGSFVARQQQLNLDWKERLQRMSVFTDDLSICLPWLQCSVCPSKADIDTWFPVRGKAFQEINSSRFCDVNLLHMYNDVLTHAQYLQRPVSDEDYCQFHKKCLGTVMTLFDDGVSVVSVSYKDNLSDILSGEPSQKFRPDSSLVMAIPPPLTQIIAALIYICGQCFTKVTVVIPEQTALPLCYLVAIGYKSSSESLISYLPTIQSCNHTDSVSATSCSETSRTRDKLLEIVPLHRLCGK